MTKRGRHARRRSSIVVALALVVLPSPAYGRAGDLDQSFGRLGRVTTDVTSGSPTLSAIGSQPDGKLLAVGYFVGNTNGNVLVRYNADGSLDPGFGMGGRLFETGEERSPGDVALQPDGRFITAEESFSDGYDLVRREADGTIDATFGVEGRVTTSFPGGSVGAGRLTRQEDGGLVVSGGFSAPLPAGAGRGSVARSLVALARYRADGSLDARFGGDGRVTTSLGPGSTGAADHVVQPDGKIVVAAGYSGRFGRPRSITLLRYEVDGSLDRSFGVEGRARVVRGTNRVRALALAPDGGLVVAGTKTRETSFVARRLPDGAPDQSFGREGLAVARFGSSAKFLAGVSAMALAPSGQVLLTGLVLDRADRADFGLARFTARGALDRSFGQAGLVITAFGGSGVDELPSDLSLDPGGKVVVAGFRSSPTSPPEDFILARYHTQPFSNLGPLARERTIEDFIDQGVRVPLGCSQSCRARIELTVNRSYARQHGLPTVVGRTSLGLTQPGQSSTVVRLIPKARRAFRTEQPGTLRLEVRFDAEGRTRELSRRLLDVAPVK